MKTLHTANDPCSNYGPANLLFRFSDSCMGHLNKTQTEIAVILKLPVLESYTYENENIAESFKDFCGLTVKWRPFKISVKLHRNALLFTNIFQYYKF